MADLGDPSTAPPQGSAVAPVFAHPQPMFVPGRPAVPRPRPVISPTGWAVVVVAAVGFAVCGKTVFAGLAGTLFVLGLVGALVLSGTVHRRGEPVMWLGSACALAVGLSFRGSPWLITLDMVAISTVLFLAVLCARGPSIFRCTAAGFEQAIERLVGAWFLSPLLAGSTVKWLSSRTRQRSNVVSPAGSRSRLGSAVRSLVLAAPVLFFILPLLSKGDASFAGVLGSVGDAVGWLAGGVNVDAAVLGYGLLGTWIGLTMLVIAGWQRREVVGPTGAVCAGPGGELRAGEPGLTERDTERDTKRDMKRAVFVREVTGAMWIVNTTLAAFATSQIANAVGLGNRLQRDVLSYQQIAKDGFFPLLVASALVLAALLIAHLMLGANRWEPRCVVAAQTAIALNLVVVVAASRRLWIGADIWGLTMLRVCSQAAALLLGVMLITVAAWQRVPTNRQPIVGIAVLGAVAILLVLNVLPIEQYIVNWNADRPAPDFAASAQRSSGHPLDRPESNELGVARCVDYFDKWHGMNADAMPAFAPLIAHQLRSGRVDRSCQDRLLHCDSRFDVSGLRWNFARARANAQQRQWCSVG